MVMDGDLTWGDEHTIQCTYAALWNCAPDTFIILLTNIIPIKSMKRRGKKNYLTPASVSGSGGKGQESD